MSNFGGIKGAKLFWRGPITMHRAARDGIESLIPGNFRPKKQDLIVFSFGEIDCRKHIKKQSIINNRSIEDEVNLLCSRFELSLDKYKKRKNTKIALSCIVPFSKQFLDYAWHTSERECLIEAKAIRDLMNQRLSQMSVPFVDFSSYFSDPDGSFKEGYSDNNVHINVQHSKPVADALTHATGISFSLRELDGLKVIELVEPPYKPWWNTVKGQVLKSTRPVRRQLRDRISQIFSLSVFRRDS